MKLLCLTVQIFSIEIETSQNSYVSKAQQKRFFFAESAHFFKCMLSAIKLNFKNSSRLLSFLLRFSNRNAPCLLQKIFCHYTTYILEIVKRPLAS